MRVRVPPEAYVSGVVQDSTEIDRVLAIPRREWTEVQVQVLVDRLSAALRTTTIPPRDPGRKCLACHAPPGVPCAPMTLLPLQAVALAEFATWRGAVIGIPVGGGKTLISGLAPRMLHPAPTRPLLLLPAHLIAKTEAEFADYRRHWVLPPFFRLESYQTLSRVGAAKFLEAYQPDLIVADEAHYMKNPDAAVTRRVFRHLKQATTVPLMVETGSILDVSLRDVAHLSSAALRRTNPFPETHKALDEWCRALDVDVSPAKRLGPGALARFRANPLEDTRKAYQARIRQAPGVVLSRGGSLDTPLRIRSHRLDLDQSQEDAFRDYVRKGNTPPWPGEPAGWPLEDGPAIWRVAREVATGFFSIWDPMPPDDWRDARRDWARACREILQTNRRALDTELQLVNHLDAHPDHYPHAAQALAVWRAVEPTFHPNPVPVWISDRTIEWIAAWAAEGPGLIWVDRPCVGERLRARFGIPYFGEEGIDRVTGRYVESAPPDRAIALSREANSTGRNLQAWSRNLVVDVPSRGRHWEQMIGRTHRLGQRAPLVTVDVLFGCLEDVRAFWKAHGRSAYAADMTGQAQKLQDADLREVADETEAETWAGPQWQSLTRA